MPENQIPQEPGYYWAKWLKASEDTHEGDLLTPYDTWEIVQVNWNISSWQELTDEQDMERLSVSIPGVREVQWRDFFVWGSKVSGLEMAATS